MQKPKTTNEQLCPAYFFFSFYNRIQPQRDSNLKHWRYDLFCSSPKEYRNDGPKYTGLNSDIVKRHKVEHLKPPVFLNQPAKRVALTEERRPSRLPHALSAYCSQQNNGTHGHSSVDIAFFTTVRNKKISFHHCINFTRLHRAFNFVFFQVCILYTYFWNVIRNATLWLFFIPADVRFCLGRVLERVDYSYCMNTLKVFYVKKQKNVFSFRFSLWL